MLQPTEYGRGNPDPISHGFGTAYMCTGHQWSLIAKPDFPEAHRQVLHPVWPHSPDRVKNIAILEHSGLLLLAITQFLMNE